jgi:hypothetical protein
MLRFFMEAGPFIFPVLLLGGLVLVLALWNAVVLIARAGLNENSRRQSIDSILFWGGLAAVLGFLGQWVGIGKLTRFIAREGVVSPPAVAYGISESLLTTVTGMVVLVVAVFLWFFLRVGLWAKHDGRAHP